MAEMIIKDWCPKCKAINYINDGDPTDMTGMDIDGMECHECGYKWVFYEDAGDIVDMSCAIIEKGKATISESEDGAICPSNTSPENIEYTPTHKPLVDALDARIKYFRIVGSDELLDIDKYSNLEAIKFGVSAKYQVQMSVSRQDLETNRSRTMAAVESHLRSMLRNEIHGEVTAELHQIRLLACELQPDGSQPMTVLQRLTKLINKLQGRPH